MFNFCCATKLMLKGALASMFINLIQSLQELICCNHTCFVDLNMHMQGRGLWHAVNFSSSRCILTIVCNRKAFYGAHYGFWFQATKYVKLEVRHCFLLFPLQHELSPLISVNKLMVMQQSETHLLEKLVLSDKHCAGDHLIISAIFIISNTTTVNCELAGMSWSEVTRPQTIFFSHLE